MRDYIASLIDDLPGQFRDKENIGILVAALGRQLQDVSDFLESLLLLRQIDAVSGMHLDEIGNIVCLTRMEAALLAGAKIPFDVLSDDRYRNYLKYKILLNTSDCTYGSLISAVKMFWKGERVSYREDPASPATIILTIPGFEDAGGTANLLQVPIIKAAGVGIHMETETAIVAPIHVGIIHQAEIESSWVVEDFTL